MSRHMGWGVIEEGWKKGPWTTEEDKLLIEYVKSHGEGRWNHVYRIAGLQRNGRSCRKRWVNYLRPDLKRGGITPNEERIIVELHASLGNRWTTISRSLPGRTDNEIKNYWTTHLKVKSSDQIEKARARLLGRQKKVKSSDKTKKARARHWRHQFQLQQHSQLKQDQLDMTKIMPSFDEAESAQDEQELDGNQQPQQQVQQSQLEQDQLDLEKIMSLFDEAERAQDEQELDENQASNDADMIMWDEFLNLDDYLN